MAENRRHNFEIRREPLLGFDATSHEAARAWLLKATTDHVALRGACLAEVRWLGTGLEYRCRTADAVELGDEEVLAAMLLQMATRDDVSFTFRTGEALFPGQGESAGEGDDKRRRVACVLEVVDPEARTWWLARRPFGRAPSGVGVWHGDWEVETGTGAAELPEPLREWLDTERVLSSNLALGDVTPVEEADDIRAAILDLPHGPPPTIEATVDALGPLVDQLVRSGSVPGLVVFAVRQDSLEQWEVRSRMKTTLEDLVRGIVAQAPTVAVGIVHPCVITLDGEGLRGLALIVEQAGRRRRRLLVLRRGPKGEIQGQVQGADMGPTDPANDWLHTPTEAEFTLAPLGTIVGPTDIAEG